MHYPLKWLCFIITIIDEYFVFCYFITKSTYVVLQNVQLPIHCIATLCFTSHNHTPKVVIPLVGVLAQFWQVCSPDGELVNQLSVHFRNVIACQPLLQIYNTDLCYPLNKYFQYETPPIYYYCFFACYPYTNNTSYDTCLL